MDMEENHVGAIIDRPQRKKNRLENYDYSSCGAYFITICTLERRNCFWKNVGAIIDRPQDVELSQYGKMVDNAIQNIPSAYSALSLEGYIIMPNHIHLLVRVCADEYGRPLVAPTMSRVINNLKGLFPNKQGLVFGKNRSTITLSETERITKNIYGISMKIHSGGGTTNYTQKNRGRGFALFLCNTKAKLAIKRRTYHMIQPVSNDDIKECVDIIKESFLTVANEFGFTIENAPRFTAFATTEQRLSWQLNHENRPMYAFVEEGSIIGYYSLALLENKECELNNLCVLPQFRHQGIGEKLLFHSFSAAKSLGCVKMNIGIVEENQVLKKWYESFGFIHNRTQKFDFFPFTCGYMELILT